MKTIKTLHASVPNKLYRLLSLGMVAFLLVGAFMVARPAQAAVNQTCTTNADGDWSDPIWDCGPIPASTDDVVIVNEVTIHTDQAVHSLSINPYGILQFTAPATLTLNGNFAKDVLAIFDPGNDFGLPADPSTGGTVAFGPGDHTITTNGEVVDFYNLTKIASGTNEKLLFDPQGSGGGFVHVMNSLTLKGVAGSLLSLASTLPGTKWGIESEWMTDVNYVDVQDSNNLGDAIDVAVGAGINTTNWSFGLAPTSSAVSLSASPNPSKIGQPVTFTATISPSGATSGEVAFYLDGQPIEGCESQELEAGNIATCTVSDLAVGNHEISAEYNGNETYLASTSSILNQIVDYWKSYIPSVGK